MRVVLELPDSASSLGLFLNKQNTDHTITTTNGLFKPEDGMHIRYDESCLLTVWRVDNDGV